MRSDLATCGVVQPLQLRLRATRQYPRTLDVMTVIIEKVLSCLILALHQLECAGGLGHAWNEITQTYEVQKEVSTVAHLQLPCF
jgi:hypothetical protein